MDVNTIAQKAQRLAENPRDLPYLTVFSDGASSDRDQPLLVGWPEASEAARLVGLDQSGRALLEDAVGAVVMCALVGVRDGKWVSYSLHENHYTGMSHYHPAMTYTNVKAAVRILHAHGLVVVEKGKTWAEGGKGRQSRLRASDLLVERAGDLLVRGFKAPVLREPLRLMDKNGHLTAYRETARTRQMRGNLRVFNDYIASQTIGISDPAVFPMGEGMMSVPCRDDAKIDRVIVPMTTALFRQFNGDWRHHGRFYGGFWQNLPKAIRWSLVINGAPVSSADFGNSHLRFAYSEVHADPGLEDAYTIPGHDRALVKVATNIAFNVTGRDHAIVTVAWELAQRDRVSETGTTDGAKIGPWEMGQAASVISAIERRHPAIQAILYTNAGLRFMAPESDVLAAVMKRAIALDIPVLPIHDELIMPLHQRDQIVALMSEEWSRRVSNPAIIR